ncbi:hypothetical protein V6N13_093955 [Hibiscus sabdariffa]
MTIAALEGRLCHALKLFDQIPEPESVFHDQRWNGSFFGYFGFSTVILSYRKVENMGDIDVAALVLSRRMKASNIRPDEYTRRNKVKNDVFLGNASVDLFRIRECCESSESIFGHASEGKIYMDNNDHWSLLLMAMVKKLLVCSLKC